jgi:cell division protein FtsB
MLDENLTQIHLTMRQIQQDIINISTSNETESTLHRSSKAQLDVTVDIGDIDSVTSATEIRLNEPQIQILEDQLQTVTLQNVKLATENQHYKSEFDRLHKEIQSYKSNTHQLSTENVRMAQEMKLLQDQTAQQIKEFASRNKKVKDLKVQNHTMAQMLLSIAR